MRLGSGTKLFASSLGLVAIPTAILFAYARSDIERETLRAVETDLRHRVSLGLIDSADWPESEPRSQSWQRVAARLSRASGTRVTIVRRDGTVLGESAVEGERLANVENHLLRPEIQDALRVGVGVMQRRSHTTNQDLLYLAMPFGEPNAPAGVLRMALDLGAVEREVSLLHRGAGVAAVLALFLRSQHRGG
ncbi:MAG: hypothetical protein QM784_06875 [Polyangiaceae bacterium]